MTPFADHPLRYQLANELHARPFALLNVPATALFLAVKQTDAAVDRDRSRDLAHLRALLDRHGAPHPQPGATHYSCRIGRVWLKWESHTEMVTYTIFQDGVGERAFDPAEFDVFPADWLADLPGARVCSAHIRVMPLPDPEAIVPLLADWFVPESLTVAYVLDRTAVVATDFRLDAAGHLRMAVFADPQAGPQRVGRIVQRLCEIESYKTMAMLGFMRARELSPRMTEIDRELNGIMSSMQGGAQKPEATLAALLRVSEELEECAALNAFRFGATGAYETIVNQRIAVLREERFNGRQIFSEFMIRRFDPAMRTVKSTEARLAGMADRAMRAGELLRTRVDVERSAQNQALLAAMDRRAETQLQLQKTVEGLSVVAISYYAVSLAGYLLFPLAAPLGLGKGELLAAITLPVAGAVWWMIRRIRNRLH